MTPLTCSTRLFSMMPKLTTLPSAGETCAHPSCEVLLRNRRSIRAYERSLIRNSGAGLESAHEEVTQTGVGLEVILHFVKVDAKDVAVELVAWHTEPDRQRVLVEGAVDAGQGAQWQGANDMDL